MASKLVALNRSFSSSQLQQRNNKKRSKDHHQPSKSSMHSLARSALVQHLAVHQHHSHQVERRPERSSPSSHPGATSWDCTKSHLSIMGFGAQAAPRQSHTKLSGRVACHFQRMDCRLPGFSSGQSFRYGGRVAGCNSLSLLCEPSTATHSLCI